MGKQFRQHRIEISEADKESELKPKGLLIYNPKTIICEAQAKKLENSKIGERKLFKRKRA